MKTAIMTSLILILIVGVTGTAVNATTGSIFVYIGGWDWSGSIYPFLSFGLNRDTGALTQLGGASDFGECPSYVSQSKDGSLLYITNEMGADKAGITVASLSSTGEPTKMQQIPYVASGPGAFVFSEPHPNGKFLLAADYNGGHLAVYRLQSNGQLGEQTDLVSYAAGAQTHSLGITVDGKHIFALCKGIDIISQLDLDTITGKLTRRADLASPGGPRHMSIVGDLAFVITEVSSMLSSYNISEGNLTLVTTVSSVPAGVTNTGAHVLVHPNPSMQFVYVSNRGHDSIAVFSYHEDGKLNLVGYYPTQGKTPHDFDIDAEGKFLVVANQGTGADGNLVVYAIEADGTLTLKDNAISGLTSPTAVSILNM